MGIVTDNLTLWRAADGDNTLALDWPIDENSVVWEIGGFEGRWAAQMEKKFDPFLYIFEPQMWAYSKLKMRFGGNSKITIFPFGLWTYDANLRLWEHDTDGASVVKNTGRTSEKCEFRDILHELPRNIDVCLMNIEGGEFTLIPYLLGLRVMPRFRYFWCQFHPGVVKDGEEKTELIYRGMEQTHEIVWDYYPTAVAWRKK